MGLQMFRSEALHRSWQALHLGLLRHARDYQLAFLHRLHRGLEDGVLVRVVRRTRDLILLVGDEDGENVGFATEGLDCFSEGFH